MAKPDQDQQASERRQRQFALDAIIARYQDEYRSGKSPRLEEYVRRYPHFAAELTEFGLYFHAIAADLPPPESVSEAGLSPAAQAALARLASREPPLEGLVQRGLAIGYTPPKLAEAIGISRDVLAKLEAHAIQAMSIPQTFIQRAANTLRVAPAAVNAYLQGTSSAQTSAFFYSEKAPKQEQESFLEAIQASPRLTEAQKREWAEIVARDLPDT